jgi:hypothetical protein
MKRHCKTYHNEFYLNNLICGKRQRKQEINLNNPTMSSVNNSNEIQSESGDDDSGNTITTPNHVANHALPLTEANLFHLEASSDKSGLFYLKNHDGHGMEYLVGKACFGLSIFDEGDIDLMEVQMMIQTAELVSELSHQNRERLCALTKSISSVITKIVEDKMHKKSFRPWKIHRITTMFDMRRVILEGATSLFNVIAKPVVNYHGGFGYILPSHCIQDALGHGFDLEFVQLEQNGTRRMADLVYPIHGIPPILRCWNLFNVNNPKALPLN